MESKTETPEATVTAEDLQDKWNQIKQTVRREAQRRVLGMTYTTAGGIVLGVGALGLAFWLGRRTGIARSRRGMPPKEEDVVEIETPRVRVHRGSSGVSRVLEPALETAVNTAVNAAVKSAVNAVTKRLQQETK